jgi:CubicO group peptidase (beta-lactamase class C family)
VVKKIEIQGYCDPRFSAVKGAFRKNFESGEELGASFAATIDGKFVVDIWAGFMDAAKKRPWERDTIVNVYSTTKVMTALCALMLVDRGQLDLDAPVAKYWPEFAQAGKAKIPVRYLLSHSAGLAGVDEKVPLEGLYDWKGMVKLLEKQKPLWEPGKNCGYHALTFGFLVGEVIRRITGKTVGTFFREEVAIPLNADFYIGLPQEQERRVAELIPPTDAKPGEAGYIDPATTPEVVRKAVGNPPLDANTAIHSRDRAWQAAEIPAANGHGNARSIARVGAALACGGELDGVRLLGMTTIEKAIIEQIYSKDLVMGTIVRFGLGFGLNCPEMPLGPNPRTFSWGGWGGSKMVVDLDARLSWGYAMNKMSASLLDNRAFGVAKGLYAAPGPQPK